MFGLVLDQRLWDAVESVDGLASDENAHVAQCAACASRLEEARSGLLALDALRAENVEPPPQYWETLRGDIRRQISSSARHTQSAWRPAWALLVASAAVVLGVLSMRPSAPSVPVDQRIEARVWIALPSADADASLDLVQAAVDELEEVSTDELGFSSALVAALEDVNDDEALSVARAMAMHNSKGGRL